MSYVHVENTIKLHTLNINNPYEILKSNVAKIGVNSIRMKCKCYNNFTNNV